MRFVTFASKAVVMILLAGLLFAGAAQTLGAGAADLSSAGCKGARLVNGCFVTII